MTNARGVCQANRNTGPKLKRRQHPTFNRDISEFDSHRTLHASHAEVVRGTRLLIATDGVRDSGEAPCPGD